MVADVAAGQFLDANGAACRLLGYTRDELLALAMPELLPPGTRSDAATDADERTLKRKDGTELQVEISAAALPDGRWQAFIRDVTARKRAEEALRESEQQLQRAQRVAKLGSWEWDLRTNRVVRSAQMYELLGIAPGTSHADYQQPMSLAALVAADERPRVLDTVRQAVEQGIAYSVEHRVSLPDGSERTFLWQGDVEKENGAPTRYLGTVMDITALRSAERQREAALRELEAVLEQCPVGITIVRACPASDLGCRSPRGWSRRTAARSASRVCPGPRPPSASSSREARQAPRQPCADLSRR